MQEQVAHTVPIFNSAYSPGNLILIILLYNIFSVALPEPKLAFLEALATLVMLTWFLNKPQG